MTSLSLFQGTSCVCGASRRRYIMRFIPNLAGSAFGSSGTEPNARSLVVLQAKQTRQSVSPSVLASYDHIEQLSSLLLWKLCCQWAVMVLLTALFVSNRHITALICHALSEMMHFYYVLYTWKNEGCTIRDLSDIGGLFNRASWVRELINADHLSRVSPQQSCSRYHSAIDLYII